MKFYEHEALLKDEVGWYSYSASSGTSQAAPSC